MCPCEWLCPSTASAPQEDGGYTLRGGPLDALIAYAASTTSAGVCVCVWGGGGGGGGGGMYTTHGVYLVLLL